MKLWLIAIVGGFAVACGGDVSNRASVSMPQSRHTVLWISDNVGDDQAAVLRRAGVSRVVVRRGTINLESSTPVLQIVRGPQVAGGIQVAPALLLETGERNLDATTGESLWRGLSDALGGAPAEIILDMPRLPEGSGDFVTQLSKVSGLDVVPILTVQQIGTSGGLEVARAAGSCIVPLFGPGNDGLRGAGQDVNETLNDVLQPLFGSGVGVRAGILLRPQSEPPLQGWGEGLSSLCDGGNVEILKTSSLGRAFAFKKEVAWNNRVWKPGESVDIGWMDAARLHASLAELDRMILPNVVGWDLVSMPPPGDVLGIGREALFAYLGGRGPGPELEVVGERNGRSLRVRVSNASPFSSAVSGSGHWLEVAIGEGALVVRDRGDFDTIALGSRKTGEWKPGIRSGADAVRFGETFVGPGETLRTGTIRLPSSRSDVAIRWRVVLSNGESLEGFFSS